MKKYLIIDLRTNRSLHKGYVPSGIYKHFSQIYTSNKLDEIRMSLHFIRCYYKSRYLSYNFKIKLNEKYITQNMSKTKSKQLRNKVRQ